MAVKVLNVHLEAVEGVDERDGHVGVEIVALPLEFGMRPSLEIIKWMVYLWLDIHFRSPDHSSRFPFIFGPSQKNIRWVFGTLTALTQGGGPYHPMETP